MNPSDFKEIRRLIEFGDGLNPIQLLLLDDIITQSKNRYKRSVL